jgi:oxygen-dependent protoporphyrinogen oxidase
MVGGSRQPELLELNKEILKSKILKEIKELFSYDGQIIMQHEYLWKKGIPQYGLNHSIVNESLKKFHFENKNFYVLGNFIDGISVSDCIRKAKKLVSKL